MDRRYGIFDKLLKSEKRTHFAVTESDKIAYKEFFGPFLTLGTNFYSKIVKKESGQMRTSTAHKAEK